MSVPTTRVIPGPHTQSHTHTYIYIYIHTYVNVCVSSFSYCPFVQLFLTMAQLRIFLTQFPQWPSVIFQSLLWYCSRSSTGSDLLDVWRLISERGVCMCVCVCVGLFEAVCCRAHYTLKVWLWLHTCLTVARQPCGVLPVWVWSSSSLWPLGGGPAASWLEGSLAQTPLQLFPFNPRTVPVTNGNSLMTSPVTERPVGRPHCPFPSPLG